MGKTIRVYGDVVVSGGGVAVGLEPHDGPTGINDRMLALDLVFTPTGESPQEQPVEWRGDWDEGRYEEVEFRLRGMVGEGPAPVKFETVQ